MAEKKVKKVKNKGGRPTAMTKEVVRKLEEGFMKGLSDRQCSLYTGIPYRTFRDYCERNPEFTERKEDLKDNVRMRARLNISQAILDDKNPNLSLSQWYSERRDEDFKPATKVEHSGAIQGSIELTPEISAAVKIYEETRNKQILEESKKLHGKHKKTD